MKKILITAPCHAVLPNSFKAAGYECINLPNLTYVQLKSMINDVVGLVVTTRLAVDKAILDAAQSLQWIGRLGSGLELIDVNYAAQKGIRCISTPEGNATAVAEHAMLLLLALKRNFARATGELKNKIWRREENRGTEISDKTIGIIGYGNTGGRFGKLLLAFGARVLAYDPLHPEKIEAPAKSVTLQEICEQADVISFHVPLTADTRGMANEHFFSALKKKPIIINTSRGKVIQQLSLLSALDEGLICGAGLDVLENEKLDTYTSEEELLLNEFIQDERVILTPHIAGYTHEASYKMSEMLLKKLDIAVLNQA